MKARLGKLDLGGDAASVLREQIPRFGMRILPVEQAHALAVHGLPSGRHADPFDRMLVAQAQVEGLAVLTADDAFDGYPVTRIW